MRKTVDLDIPHDPAERAARRNFLVGNEEKFMAVRDAAQALIDDVRRRYPGEDFRCEYMRALDAALKK